MIKKYFIAATLSLFIACNVSGQFLRTPSGKAYHKPGCSVLKGKQTTAVSETDKAKYTPCKRCFRPGIDTTKVLTGPRGGKYIVVNGKKRYIHGK